MNAFLSTLSTLRESICRQKPAHFWTSLSHCLRLALPPPGTNCEAGVSDGFGRGGSLFFSRGPIRNCQGFMELSSLATECQHRIRSGSSPGWQRRGCESQQQHGHGCKCKHHGIEWANSKQE